MKDITSKVVCKKFIAFTTTKKANRIFVKHENGDILIDCPGPFFKVGKKTNKKHFYLIHLFLFAPTTLEIRINFNSNDAEIMFYHYLNFNIIEYEK